MMVATKERPILFLSPMVRAILDGRKTQTRRVIKGPLDFIGGKGDRRDDPTCYGWADEYGDYYTLAPEGQDRSRVIPCPYGRVGDRLWVREPFAKTMDSARGWNESAPDGSWPIYAATDCEWEVIRWRPSIHMPRWASRITLEITGVWAERLHGITWGDCWSGGILEMDGAIPRDELIDMAVRIGEAIDSPRPFFACLWDRINGKKYPWASNPWVWALKFRVLEIKGRTA